MLKSILFSALLASAPVQAAPSTTAPAQTASPVVLRQGEVSLLPLDIGKTWRLVVGNEQLVHVYRQGKDEVLLDALQAGRTNMLCWNDAGALHNYQIEVEKATPYAHPDVTVRCGEVKAVSLSGDLKQFVVGDDRILRATSSPGSRQQILVIGEKVGDTNVLTRTADGALRILRVAVLPQPN